MKISSLLLLSIFIWVNAIAQPQGQVRFDHLTHEDGLSQTSGLAILQDSFGYMWYGTLNGLNKYNGYEFTVYKHEPDDSTSLSNSHISYLYEDSDKNLWVGTTGGGLNYFDREKDRFIHYKTNYIDHHESISDNSVSAIIEDTEGKFWIGTSSGLNLLDRETNEFIHFYEVAGDPNTLSSSNITSLYVDSHEKLWIGTTNGLNYWDNITGTFGHYQMDTSDPNSISDNIVSDVYEDRSGNLWIGTSGGGINLFDREAESFIQYMYDEDDPNSISGNTILSIVEDSRNVLWIGTENNGLNAFDPEEEVFHHYKNNVSNPASLTHNSVYTLYESNDQILWIGTYSGGISFLDRKLPKFEHYKHDPFDPKPLSNNSVLSFLETSGGILLVGTDGGGLNVFDRNSHEFDLHLHDPENPNTLSGNVILSLHEDQKGRIWVGYYNGGVSVYDPADGSVKHFRHDPDDPFSISSDHVFVIHEGREGELWFGTNGGGINKLDQETGRFEIIGTDTPGSGVTRAMYDDAEGNLWVGSYGGGLIQLDKNDGTVINQYFEGLNGLKSNVVLTIHEDHQNNMWVGTYEGGIHLFDRENQTFKSYSLNEGLPSPVVMGILEDEKGDLWISTANGLSNFSPETETFMNYNVEHGIQGSEFNTLAYYKDSEGFMYFGGTNGFNRFHPDRVVIAEEVPPVVFTDIKIFNQSVSIGDESPLTKHISQTEELVLPYTASVLTFDYVALNFNKIKGDQFAYMLEGFENDWNYVGQRRSATYTNLNPGKYTLKVKAANSYGVWGDTGRSLVLTITPPFWNTTWFYFMSVLLLAGVIGGGLRWRVRNITLQNKRLEKEVSKQTSELSDNNLKLQDTLKELKEARSKLVEKAHKAGMADLATNVLHNVGNILNSVNVSSAMIDGILKNSKIQNLQQANRLLRENEDDLDYFILNDPKGKKLLQYYLKLEKPVAMEYDQLMTHNSRLSENIKLIMDVVSAQQTYSNAGKIIERLSLASLMDDTLTLQSGSIDRHGLNVVKDYQPVEKVNIEKSKMMHVLVNLLKNAKESMSELEKKKREIKIKLNQDQEYIYLSITDKGCGIPGEHIDKIFNHGFTTKSYGHGFGLHSCSNYMQEMGGKIKLESKGIDMGATVTLCLPRPSQGSKITLKADKVTEIVELESD